MTGYRAALPGPAGSAENGSPQTGDARIAALAEILASGAGRLLVGASVYREPADRNALLFQVGRPDSAAAWAPGRPGPVPPYLEPADLDDMIAECQSAGLLTLGFATLGTVFVDRWTADELSRALEAAGQGPDLAAAHRRAAEYWRWRTAAWPQGPSDDLHDLIEARYHLLAAGETTQACQLTETACSQLHARGDFGHEAALIGDTLVRLPQHSAQRAAWIYELGKIAQVSADYVAAERCFQQALDIFAAAGDRAGVARCRYSLGVVAQARGDYATAELCYQQFANETSDPADPGDPAATPAATPGDPATTPADPAATPGDPAATPGHPPATLAEAAPHPAEAAAPVTPRATRRRLAAWKRLTGQAAQWHMPALAGLALGLLALSVTEIFTMLTSAGAASPAPPSAAESGPAAAGREAAAWVAGQISRSAIVSCDPAMCSELEISGVPAGDLLMLGPEAAARSARTWSW